MTYPSLRSKVSSPACASSPYRGQKVLRLSHTTCPRSSPLDDVTGPAPFTSRSPTLLYASRAAGWQRAQLGGVVSGGFPRGRAVGVRRVTHLMRLPHESVLSLHTALRGYPRRSRRTLVTPQHCMFAYVCCGLASAHLRVSSRNPVALASLCRSRRSLAVLVRAVAVPCVWRRPRLPPVRSRLSVARASVVTLSRRACR